MFSQTQDLIFPGNLVYGMMRQYKSVFYSNLVCKGKERNLKDLYVFEVSLQLPKGHRKIQNGVNHPTAHNTRHFQLAVNKYKTR